MPEDSFTEGASSVISLPQASVLSGNEGKLVHVSGTAVTDDIVTDTEFDVAVKTRQNIQGISPCQLQTGK